MRHPACLLLTTSFRGILLFCFVCSFPCGLTDEGGDRPRVNLQQGVLEGTWKQTDKGRRIEAFLAIPYAKPPVGGLRFKNPETAGPWTGVRDASNEPSVCIQTDESKVGKLAVTGDEDCLYLNVYTPSTKTGKKYPVMVWIHGGGFTNGAGISNFYGPHKLLNKDVILVTIQYRLGILGFASTEDDVLPGNFGLKDQALAIKWVRDNIKEFDGDCENISVFGQSAGGASAHYQSISPLSQGLFQRVMPMSGSVDCPWAMSPPGYVARQTKKIGPMVNCSNASSKELVDCLRTIPASVFPTLLIRYTIWRGYDPVVVFTPVFESEGAEGAFITAKSFQNRKDMPMMTGVTTEEGVFSVSILMRNPNKLEDLLSEYDRRFNEIFPVAAFFNESDIDPAGSATKMKKYFFGSNHLGNDTTSSLIDLYTDSYFLQGVTKTIRKHNGPAFVYKFGYQGAYSISQGLTNTDFRYGATHGDDLLYLFPLMHWTVTRQTGVINEEDEKMCEIMVELFTNFATYGNPTPEGKPAKWDPVSKENLEYFSITNDGLKMETNFPTGRDEFWKNISWRAKLLPE